MRDALGYLLLVCSLGLLHPGCGGGGGGGGGGGAPAPAPAAPPAAASPSPSASAGQRHPLDGLHGDRPRPGRAAYAQVRQADNGSVISAPIYVDR